MIQTERCPNESLITVKAPDTSEAPLKSTGNTNWPCLLSYYSPLVVFISACYSEDECVTIFSQKAILLTTAGTSPVNTVAEPLLVSVFMSFIFIQE